MARIEDIILTNAIDPKQIIALLQRKKKAFKKPLELVINEYDVTKHKVFDLTRRKRKQIKTKTDDKDPLTGKPIYKTKYVERVRIGVPIQKTIVNRSVGFLLGNPVEYKIDKDVKTTDKEQELMEAVVQVFKNNKIEYFDKRLVRDLFSYRECAELWYYILDENGKPTNDIRVKLLSPRLGDRLYPHFDEYDRLDGFGRVYTTTEDDGSTTEHYDIYTKNYVYAYSNGVNGLKIEQPKKHGFNKLPIVYYRQDNSEWEDVQGMIERIEECLSNWGDTNDYFGMPSYVVQGKIQGFADKGEQGRVYQCENDAKMSVLSWDSSPESVKGELNTLFSLVFSYTQTPDISFDNMKTISSNTSGVAIKLMFTDPHMKAEMKIETIGEMFERRCNIVKDAYSTINAVPESVANNLYMHPVFHPYMPINESETIQMLLQQTGGKPIMSQEEAVRQNPKVGNADKVLEQIKQEKQEELTESVFGSANE